jgi:hypothetical protein
VDSQAKSPSYERPGAEASSQPVYSRPRLLVHGTVADLTRMPTKNAVVLDTGGGLSKNAGVS